MSSQRVRHLGVASMLLFGMVLARIATLELHDGDELRSEATRSLSREFRVPALRGRILAADGTV
ncbi:MAG TPA: hypothetical protein VHV77_15480, partial [Pirellulales bacterium]|nr:hypothetical protein [Pirellulales bacterium]